MLIEHSLKRVQIKHKQVSKEMLHLAISKIQLKSPFVLRKHSSCSWFFVNVTDRILHKLKTPINPDIQFILVNYLQSLFGNNYIYLKQNTE